MKEKWGQGTCEESSRSEQREKERASSGIPADNMQMEDLSNRWKQRKDPTKQSSFLHENVAALGSSRPGLLVAPTQQTPSYRGWFPLSGSAGSCLPPSHSFYKVPYGPPTVNSHPTLSFLRWQWKPLNGRVFISPSISPPI